MANTQNLNLYKGIAGSTIETFNVETMLNENWDRVDAAINDNTKMSVASGTGAAITLTISSVLDYIAYQKITFIASADNAGVVTTIKVNSLGAKNLYKPNTTTVPNLI